MANLYPSMRLKVKPDTFFLPYADGSVYFRNNEVSFQLQGSTVQQWIEKLMPVFDGEHTLSELTDGLPDEYRDRVYDLAGVLYENSFVRDVNLDLPHQLPDQILKKHAAQIEFLDQIGGSGAYRFQSYRQAKVLAVGSGPFFVSLVSVLLESGMQNVHMLTTDSVPTHRQRISELAAHARTTDPDVALHEVTRTEKEAIPWQEMVQPYDFVLYVSHETKLDELRALKAACLEEKKVFIPAICAEQVGLAGPVVQPIEKDCWESMWRRLHQVTISKDPQLHMFSSTSMAVLANVIVFELLLAVTEVEKTDLKHKFFLLNLETLEGNWHTFLPHPMVVGISQIESVQDVDLLLEQSANGYNSNRWFAFFHSLTAVEAGFFHIWEEGDLKQLPLAQCRVQVADPLSKGPAPLLPDIVCAGLTHEEARRDAGLTGIEAYVSCLIEKEIDIPTVEEHEFVGVGTGETVSEGMHRGLQKCLANLLRQQHEDQLPTVSPVDLCSLEDERCMYYMQVLAALHEAPSIGLGKEICGFPVVWIGTQGQWIGSVDLNVTMALRKGLQEAILKASSQEAPISNRNHLVELSTVIIGEKESRKLVIPAFDEMVRSDHLQSAFQALKRNRKRFFVFDLALEPFLKQGPAGVFGVLLREEESK